MTQSVFRPEHTALYRQRRRFILSKAVGVGAVLAGTIAGIATAAAAAFTPINATSAGVATATAQAFSPLNASSAGIATVTATTFTQIAIPTADSFPSSWTDNTGANTNLYASIDEAGPNDADYIQSSTSAGIGDEALIRLAPILDPVSSSGHILRYRYGKDVAAGDNVDLVVTLYDSDATTVIHTVTHSNVSNTLTDGSFTLSSGETDAITGYAAGLVLGLKRG